MPPGSCADPTVLYDRDRPCLSCGADWRIVIDEIQDVTGTVTLRASAGTCSARCWVSDFDGYDRGLLARLDRDWVPWSTRR